MRIFSKLPALVHLRRQCSACCFVIRASLQTAANLLPTSDWRQEAGGSGGKNYVTGIPSKFNCDSESRAVLVECAQAIARCKNKSLWVEEILRRKPKKVALIAIANKLARQVWAMANKGESFKQMAVLTA